LSVLVFLSAWLQAARKKKPERRKMTFFINLFERGR
jgi:hypothetical protein